MINNTKTRLFFYALFASLLFWSSLKSYNTSPKNEWNILVVDALYHLDDSFYLKLSSLIDESQFQGDYIIDKNVTISNLKKIEKDYSIIVFRVHSAIYLGGTWIITRESYKEENLVVEQMLNEVQRAKVDYDEDYYFAVGDEFFRHYLRNQQNSIIIVMGCRSFYFTDLANVFKEKGASYYIGWDGQVTLEYTDKSILHLLEIMLDDPSFMNDKIMSEVNKIKPFSDTNAKLKIN